MGRPVTFGLVAVVAATSLALAVAAPANAVAGGTALIVTEKAGSTVDRVAAESGGVATNFSLQVPLGAACSGDSATGLYRVQSFMVPAGTAIDSLQFGAKGPTPTGLGPNFRQPLYDPATQPYANALTAPSTEPGGTGPGVIINVPLFNLALFGADELPAGDYLVGLACTKGSASATQLDRYWSTKVNLNAAAPGAAASWKAAEYTPPSTTPSKSSEPAAPAPSERSIGNAATDLVHSDVAAQVADPEATGGAPSFSMPMIKLPAVVSSNTEAVSLIRSAAILALFLRLGLLLRRRPAVIALAGTS